MLLACGPHRFDGQFWSRWCLVYNPSGLSIWCLYGISRFDVEHGLMQPLGLLRSRELRQITPSRFVTYSGDLGGRVFYTHGVGVTPPVGLSRSGRSRCLTTGSGGPHARLHPTSAIRSDTPPTRWRKGRSFRGFRSVRPLESRPLDKLSPVPQSPSRKGVEWSG
jgi:hypothetical protein